MRSDQGEQVDQDYFPLDVQTLRLDVTTNFALFMKRGKGKPVLYRGKNTQFTGEILDNLRRNNVEQLWVPAEDWEEYQKYLTENLNAMVDDPNIPTETKCEVAYEAANKVMEEAFSEEFNSEKFEDAAKKVFEPMTKVMLGGSDAVKKFVNLTSQDYSLYAKAVNMSLLGMLMVRKIMGVTDPKYLIDLGAGFLLCDISKMNWPEEISKRRGILLPEEWELVRKHPLESLEMVRDVPLSNEARIIIEQHHERVDGTGYPKGLKGNEIHQLAKIASLADAFSALNMKRPFADHKKTFEALQTIKTEMIGHVDLDLFAQFVQLFSQGNPLDKMKKPVHIV